MQEAGAPRGHCPKLTEPLPHVAKGGGVSSSAAPVVLPALSGLSGYLCQDTFVLYQGEKQQKNLEANSRQEGSERRGGSSTLP